MLRDKLELFLGTLNAGETESTYRGVLGRLFGEFPDPTEEQVLLWVAKLRQKNANNTVYHRISVLKSFLRFVDTPEADHLIRVLDKLKVKQRATELDIPSDAIILKAAEKAKEYDHLDHLLLVLMGENGLRVGEALSLTVRACDLDSKRIRFIRKGGDWANLPMGRQAEEAIKARLSVLGRVPANTKLIPFSYSTAWRRVKRYFPDDPSVHPHSLRHSAATRMQRKTRDVTKTGLFLGHRSLNSTRRYVHMTDADIEQALRGDS